MVRFGGFAFCIASSSLDFMIFFRSVTFTNAMSFEKHGFWVPAGTRGLYLRARVGLGPGPIQKLRARVPENP